MQLAELLALLPGQTVAPDEVDRALASAPPLDPSQRSQLRGHSLAVLDPEDFYGVALYVRRHRPSATYSLAQLPLGEASRNWLLAWPQRVKAASLGAALLNPYFDPARGCRSSECLALTVLWFASEWGREHAEDGEIWTCVAPAFAPQAREQLFAQGQPRAALKMALEQACQRFDLRHAFGREGAQAYYQTVYLQFGLTRRSLRHLEHWLGGATPPRAVTMLRQDCSEFAWLFSQLRSIHEGRADAATVAGHPFLPRGWLPESGSGSASWWRLGWTADGEVQAVVNLAEAFGEVPDGHYELSDEADLWLLVSLEAGQWSPATLEVPLRSAHWLLRSLSQSQQSWTAGLELPDDDLLLWDEAGRLRGVEARPRKDWSLRFRSDWKLLSPTSRWVRQGTWSYARILEGPLQLLDAEGCEVALELGESPLKALELRLEPRRLQLLPNHITGVLLQLPQDCKLQSLTTPAGPALHHEFLDDLEVQLPVDTALPRAQLAVRVRARDRQGKTWTRCLQAPLDLDAITWNPQGQWELFRDLKQADVAVLEQVPFRFFLAQSELALLEGEHYLGRPPARTGPLTGLLGLGAPLRLKPGPYNQAGPGRVLVHSLHHQGLCQGLEWEGGRYRLSLRRPIFPDADFCLVWWNGHSAPVLQPLEASAEPVRLLQGQVGLEGRPLVALAYRGRRMGACWQHLQLRQMGGFSSPGEAFGFLRWLELPWLEWTWEMILREQLRGQEAEALLAWTQECGLVLGHLSLAYRPAEAMQPVARRMLGHFAWSPQQAWQLLQSIHWTGLMHIHPQLLLNVLQISAANQEMRVIARELQTADGWDGLWSRAAQEMQVDRKWLEHCCELYFSEVRGQEDVALALCCSAFRELVTALALE